MSEIIARLTAALAEHYAIKREVGAGGMATVYLADDLKHKRQVAIKVLRPELAASLGSERFLREIEIAARLQHPHILPLYDSGEADGFLYYVMPYVEGESLADRLKREKQLPVDDVLTIATEVAGALAYAHDHGVVHRDIKPGNIMLSGGHGVVADFGIARAVSAAGGEELTQTGLAVGTPTYMSPEQAAGEVDGRSDIYALACVVYEMLAGEPPFTGPSAQAIIARHAMDTPHSLRTIRSSLSSAIEVAITRAMEKVPVDRYQTAGEFADALRQKDETWPAAASRRQIVIGAAAAAAAALVVVAAVVGVRSRSSGSVPRGPPTIAVLPAENLGALDDEYFADGMTEEITNRLIEISGLRVKSRTSAKRFKGSLTPIREIGESLQVEYLLENTIRSDRGPSGTGQVLVAPKLTRTSDGTHLWTQTFSVTLIPGEIFGVQADIAEQVAAALNVTLLETELDAVRAMVTEDSVAYRLYRLGRFELRKRGAESIRVSQQLFRDAIAQDTGFAAAYAGLADAISLYNFYFASEQGPTAWAPAEAAARKAVALDSNLAEAHASLGLALMYGQWNWNAARRSYERSLELDRDDADVWVWLAEVDWAQGRLDSALEKTGRALDLDPLSPVATATHGMSIFFVGRLDGLG